MDSPNNNIVDDQDQEEVQLPGFRFHPTDEELVGFYLRRKVDMKPISIELIKTIDIYKFDPWDLPKASCTSGDKEWYFFSKRGRKYKNSVRPNRVTGSGFWKATGIDKPVNSLPEGDNNNNNPILLGNNHKNNEHCIGLKKTLVYYRGSAGKGTKTDWMMHEFRLPAINNDNKSSPVTDNDILQEAEIWTLCRIFKRTVSYRKYTQDWRELSSKRSQPDMDTNISYKKRNSMESNKTIEDHNYIDFSAPIKFHDQEKKPAISNNQITVDDNNDNIGKYYHGRGATNQVLHVSQLSSMATHINYSNNNNNNYNYYYNNNNNNNVMDYDSSMSSSLLADENDYTSWDELRAVVEYALDPALT